MVLENGSLVTEFILLGLTNDPDLLLPLLLLFLIIYTTTILGNFSLVILIVLNSYPHIPIRMLFFAQDVCSYLMLGSYMMELCGAMIHTGCILRLTFCAGTPATTISVIFALCFSSCTGTYFTEIEILIVGGKDFMVPSINGFTSYGFILCSILPIRSTEGIYKAFSACSSYILAVSLFFISGAFIYLQSSSVESMDQGKISSVFYTIVFPMMNSLIYCLRNKVVKVLLRKTFSRRL
uniref:G-protein coupled receptors family 1 profile domain-containing protein n=1 Tax=Cricetulus griseus TaxID=10029 RepID=A0A8C2QJ05_CRIGR